MATTGDTSTPLYDRFKRSHDTGAELSPQHDERSVGEVVSDLTQHAQQLVRGEIDLFKAEMTDKAKAAATYIAMAAAAVVLALVSIAFVGHLLTTAFDIVMPTWAAWLVTTLLYLGASAALGYAAVKGFRQTDLAPTEAVESAKEDIRWVTAHR